MSASVIEQSEIYKEDDGVSTERLRFRYTKHGERPL